MNILKIKNKLKVLKMITIDVSNISMHNVNAVEKNCCHFQNKLKQDLDESRYKRAGLILFNRGKILLVFGKSSKKWSFPKGRKNNEEELSLYCAIREFEEETGILLTNEEICQIKFFFRTSHCVYYSIEINHDIDFIQNPKFNHEISKVRYVSIDELKGMDNLNYDLKMFCKTFV